MSTTFNPNQTYPYVRSYSLSKKYYYRIACLGWISDYLNAVPSSLGEFFSTPSEFISSIRAYPFDIGLLDKSVTPTLSDVWIGTQNATTTISGLRMYSLYIVKPTIHLGTYKFKKKYNSYLDYAPYTKITVWLPFISFVELDPNEVMGRTVSFDYAIDLDSGEATAIITIIDTEKPYVIRTQSGKIGIDLPIGSTNTREIAKNFLQSTLGLGTSIISAVSSQKGLNATSGLGIVLKTTGSMANALQHHYSRSSGAINGLNNLPLPNSIYVIYERNNLEYSPIETKGKPLMEQRELNEIHGYCEVAKFWEIMNFGSATKDEVDEIKNLLIGGVYLP